MLIREKDFGIYYGDYAHDFMWVRTDHMLRNLRLLQLIRIIRLIIEEYFI
jgi:hypothetical protein